ncbi:hypothetical protein [Escherichia coli]|uniref:hypothetical protein n=1 Tax=Escherichia coli TaxID=562 RepID=UPI003F664F56
MGSCAAPSAKGDDKFITTDYLQQCQQKRVRIPAMKVSEWGHLLRALEIERVCH